MDAGTWIVESRRLIDQWILDDVAGMGSEQGSVEEAMQYSLTAGGKRVRPQLVLAGGAYVGIEPDRLKPAALAVEYLHTYSLIHDDLPAMDNDDMRRGRPTSHKVFGEATAILAGDALLTEAFVKMAELYDLGFPAAGVVKAMGTLAQKAGRQGLVRGQIQDLASERQEISVKALQEIHEKKTGALFEASLTIPAQLVGDDQAALQLGRFGRHFGLAFQMVDDILNVVGDAARLGKATGTDAGLGKATYPRLVGIKTARSLLSDHVREALAGLDPARAGLLEGLLRFAAERTW